MPTIALTQEMGSLSHEVGQRVADLVGASHMRSEVIEHVAGRMHVPPSLIRRLREGQAGFIERRAMDNRELALFTADEVFAQAERGNVVLRGWGATCLLCPVQHVVRVRVTRPLAQRVDWLMESLGTDNRESAEAEVRRSDASHASRMHAQFGVTWGDPLLYDLVLNTERISIDSCAQQILALAARPEFQETPESKAVLAGLALSARVRAALRANESTREVDVQIDGKDGTVVLNGIVLHEQEKAETERVAGAVAGVDKVESHLHMMAISRRFAYSRSPATAPR